MILVLASNPALSFFGFLGSWARTNLTAIVVNVVAGLVVWGVTTLVISRRQPQQPLTINHMRDLVNNQVTVNHVHTYRSLPQSTGGYQSPGKSSEQAQSTSDSNALLAIIITLVVLLSVAYLYYEFTIFFILSIVAILVVFLTPATVVIIWMISKRVLTGSESVLWPFSTIVLIVSGVVCTWAAVNVPMDPAHYASLTPPAATKGLAAFASWSTFAKSISPLISIQAMSFDEFAFFGAIAIATYGMACLRLVLGLIGIVLAAASVGNSRAKAAASVAHHLRGFWKPSNAGWAIVTAVGGCALMIYRAELVYLVSNVHVAPLTPRH